MPPIRPLFRAVALLLALVPATGAADPAAAHNRFAAELFAKVAAEKGNVFLSPASLHSALSLIATGAQGKTADQFSSVLHTPASGARASGALLQQWLGGKSRDVQLSVANALWVQKGIDLRPAFLRSAKANFGATADDADFLGNPESARRAINAWVARATRDRITELMPQGSIVDDTRLVLTNAIYFKAAWRKPFDKSDTRPLPFKLASGERVNVPTMIQSGLFRYARGSGFQALMLPYKGDELTLIVLLPNSPRDLARLEKDLAARLPTFTDREVDVALPRFRFADDRELSAPLAALGLTDAFSPRADFSALTATSALRLSAVIHKAVVEVNEQGTEAAAATGLAPIALGLDLDKPVAFRADRPFAFLIRHEKSGAILFAGRVADPRAN